MAAATGGKDKGKGKKNAEQPKAPEAAAEEKVDTETGEITK